MIVLCDLQGVSYNDASVAMGCAVGTIRSRLHRARNLLSQKMGCAMASGHVWLRWGTRAIGLVTALALVAICAILWMVRGLPTPGDIASALTSNPDVYTLSLGHMTDLTMSSFAYLRAPLAVAAVAFGVGTWGAWRLRGGTGVLLALVAMMVLFFHAARMALVVFDPYMSSRPLAEALVAARVDALAIDSAHGHSSRVLAAVTEVKKRFPQIDLMAGNIATYDGAIALIDAGADAIKVGIGPGSICTTRMVTGAGMPQITAISEAYRAGKERARGPRAIGPAAPSGRRPGAGRR